MAAAAAAEGEAEVAEGPRLWELVEAAWRLLDEVEGGGGGGGVGGAESSSGAASVQSKVQRGIALLERAARAVAQLDLFSRHEELEEVSSSDLRFVLLPALLGALVLRQVSPERRLEHLRRARGAFRDFLRLAHDFGLARRPPPPEPGPPDDAHHDDDDDDDAPPTTTATPPQDALLAMAASRRAKIERYRQTKELERRLAALRSALDGGRADDEQIREFYLLQIAKWVNVSLEEIESIDQEIAILSRRDALKQGSAAQPSPAARPPRKPFILTRDAAQAKVFGAGYPSLATMSVDDWYEQHRKQGVLPDQGLSQAAPARTEERQKNEKELQEEKEEEEEGSTVWKAREWDDWKDMHPRGYGNRKNMG